MASELAASVGSDGFVTVDLLDASQVQQAREVVRELGLARDHGFFASPADAWGSVAVAADRALRSVVEEPLARILPSHRVFLAGVTSKGVGSETCIPFHQDWTYTDERRWRAIFFWCPLVDVDEGSGALAVVPGSHRWSQAIRPARRSDAARGLQVELQRAARTIPLSAGEAVVFDPATVHGSGPNRSDRSRPAVTVALVPREATLVNFVEDGPCLSGFEVDEQFFTAHEYGARPVGYPSVEPYARAITERDIRRGLRRRRSLLARRR